MAKVKEIVEKPSYEIGLKVKSFVSSVREPDPDDEWDAGETDTSYSLYGLVYPVPKKGSYDLEIERVEFEPQRGETYYVLYGVYSTGNSFGRDYGGGFEVVGIYRDLKAAERNKKILDEAEGAKKSMVTLYTESGKPYQMSVPWHGYFESLDYLEIEAFTL